jgi:hypothetical protein
MALSEKTAETLRQLTKKSRPLLRAKATDMIDKLIIPTMESRAALGHYTARYWNTDKDLLEIMSEELIKVGYTIKVGPDEYNGYVLNINWRGIQNGIIQSSRRN